MKTRSGAGRAIDLRHRRIGIAGIHPGRGGADVVAAQLAGSVMSAVNLYEVMTRLIDLEDAPGLDRMRLIVPHLEITAFDAADAEVAADLRARTKSRGVSLGDRACLALALIRDLPILTSDRRMASVDVGVDIRLIR